MQQPPSARFRIGMLFFVPDVAEAYGNVIEATFQDMLANGEAQLSGFSDVYYLLLMASLRRLDSQMQEVNGKSDLPFFVILPPAHQPEAFVIPIVEKISAWASYDQIILVAHNQYMAEWFKGLPIQCTADPANARDLRVLLANVLNLVDRHLAIPPVRRYFTRTASALM